jgi:Na+-driven multidrug efflux pump
MTFMNGQAFATSATSLVSQSLGKVRHDMAMHYSKRTQRIGMGTAACIAVFIFFCNKSLIGLYNSDPMIVATGSALLSMVAIIQPFQASQFIYAGALRGAGDAKAPMVIMLFSFVLFRQMYLAIGTQFEALNNPWFVGLGYPAGWAMCSALQLTYYYKSKWRERCQARWAAEDAAKELKKVSE